MASPTLTKHIFEYWHDGVESNDDADEHDELFVLFLWKLGQMFSSRHNFESLETRRSRVEHISMFTKVE